MLSYISEKFGRSPTKPEMTVTRRDSLESAFARVNARNSSKDASTTPSLTTGSSLADNSSEATEESGKKYGNDRSSTHLQTSNGSYNENVLSDGKDVRLPLEQSAKGESAMISAGTLVGGGGSDSRERLLQQSVQALDEDWDIGAMPGDDLKMPKEDEGGVRRRKSSRLDIVMDQASSLMEKTTNVLGKRSREAMEAGKETIQAFRGTKKSSILKPTETERPSFEPPKRRARFSAASIMELSTHESKSRPTSKKPSKHWIKQGLYVGQSPDFDPRLTETKNKSKRASTQRPQTHKSSAMPLPMFAGERTLTVGRPFLLPFDVFSPLPPGQPKPDEWKKTHKNVFIGDAAAYWKKAKPQEHSMCICTKENGCDEQCLNRFMLYECDDHNCNVGAEHCTNRAFADLKERCKSGENDAKKKYNIGVEVTKTLDRGYGVRANRSFEPRQIVIEYTGEIITQDECDNRMYTRYKDAECYYLMDFDQSMVLDATRGSIARFINHSCAPNCRMIKWTVSGKPRMALFAGDEGIMTGEELTYDYNFDPFSAKNVQECRCGTENCRGVLGPKPKEMKEALKPITDSKKRKIQEIGDEMFHQAVDAVTKKRKIAVPFSAKSAFATAKSQTSRRLSQASMLTASTVPKEGLTKKRSTNKLKRKSTINALGDEEKKEKPAKDESRRKSTGNLLPRGWKGWALVPDMPPESPAKDKPEAGSKWTSVEETKDARAGENVVRTVRRSSRGTPGKSIRVVALGGDELKEWR